MVSSIENESIRLLDVTLTPDQSGPGSNGTEAPELESHHQMV